MTSSVNKGTSVDQRYQHSCSSPFFFRYILLIADLCLLRYTVDQCPALIYSFPLVLLQLVGLELSGLFGRGWHTRGLTSLLLHDDPTNSQAAHITCQGH